MGAKTPKQRALVVEILEQLEIDGFLSESTPGKFKALQRSTVEEGIFIRRSNGKNSVDTANDDGKPIFVAERNSMHALNGDKVLVHISAAREGMEPEAEVIKILERKEQVFTGTLLVKNTLPCSTPTASFWPPTSSFPTRSSRAAPLATRPW